MHGELELNIQFRQQSCRFSFDHRPCRTDFSDGGVGRDIILTLQSLEEGWERSVS